MNGTAPLLPNTATAKSAVVVSITSIVAAFGWLVEKLIYLDEKVVTHERILENVVAEDGIQLHERLKGLEVAQSNLQKEQDILRKYYDAK